jgi:hypothetical protein
MCVGGFVWCAVPCGMLEDLLVRVGIVRVYPVLWHVLCVIMLQLYDDAFDDGRTDFIDECRPLT